MHYPPLPPEDLEHVLLHTGKLWEEMRGERVFITGGTGFFGMWLLESFAYANDALRLGMRATILTRDPAAFARKAPHLVARQDLSFWPGDVRDFSFPEGSFTDLIHAAADTRVWMKKECADGHLDSVVTGTRRVLDFAAHAGVENFLLVGSGAVYGPQPSGHALLPEDYAGAPDPLLPASAWGEGKRVAEHMCALHAARHDYALKIARCFTFVGPHLPLDAQYAVGNFIGDVRAGRPIRITGDGTSVRSYLYAADLAIWLWTILVKGTSGRAYNVGSDENVTIRALADVVVSSHGGHGEVIVEQTASPGNSIGRYVPDIGRAKRELGLTPGIDLQSAIKRTLRWLSLCRSNDEG